MLQKVTTIRVMPILWLIIIIAYSVVLTACFDQIKQVNDGYQFGDISRMTVKELGILKQAHHDYCDKNNDSTIRSVALALLRTELPMIPPNGICEITFNVPVEMLHDDTPPWTYW